MVFNGVKGAIEQLARSSRGLPIVAELVMYTGSDP